MTRLNDLSREYEARHFPASRRLDLQNEGPHTARERALQWLQSRAHETPGDQLLLIVERGRRAGGRPMPVRAAVEELLRELEGGLLEWWHPFGEGSLAVRLALEPRLRPRPSNAPREPAGEGRTPETAGAAAVSPHADIPPELRQLAGRAAELRRDREGFSVGTLQVVLHRVWIEAQADAMAERVDWQTALRRILEDEEARAFDE